MCESQNHAQILSNIPTPELKKELNRREINNTGRCSTCGGKWSTYMGCSRSWREELHCFGCRKPVENCICSH